MFNFGGIFEVSTTTECHCSSVPLVVGQPGVGHVVSSLQIFHSLLAIRLHVGYVIFSLWFLLRERERVNAFLRGGRRQHHLILRDSYLSSNDYQCFGI